MELIMKNLVSKVKNFLNREDGVTAIEYAVVVAGVAVVAIAIFQTGGPVDEAIRGVFSQLQTKLTALWAS
jgi:pilus assembly protein Flp/PilA